MDKNVLQFGFSFGTRNRWVVFAVYPAPLSPGYSGTESGPCWDTMRDVYLISPVYLE